MEPPSPVISVVMPWESLLRLPQHIDKAGGDHLAGCVDCLLGARAGELSDGRDAIVRDCDIAAKPRVTSAIHNPAVPNDEVIFRRLRIRLL